MPYVKNDQLFVCPSAPHLNYVPDPTPHIADYYPRGGYAGNVAYWGGSGVPGISANYPWGFRSLAYIADPAGTFMVWDTRGYFEEGWPNVAGQPTTYDPNANPPGLLTNAGWRVIAGRHTDGANFSYVDGHMKWNNLTRLLVKSTVNGVTLPPFTIEQD